MSFAVAEAEALAVGRFATVGVKSESGIFELLGNGVLSDADGAAESGAVAAGVGWAFWGFTTATAAMTPVAKNTAPKAITSPRLLSIQLGRLTIFLSPGRVATGESVRRASGLSVVLEPAEASSLAGAT